MITYEKCRIYETEYNGVTCKVEIATPIVEGKIFNDSIVIVSGNFLENPLKMEFANYGALDKFIRSLSSTIRTHDLADGIDSILNFLDYYDVGIDCSDPFYVIE